MRYQKASKRIGEAKENNRENVASIALNHLEIAVASKQSFIVNFPGGAQRVTSWAAFLHFSHASRIKRNKEARDE